MTCHYCGAPAHIDGPHTGRWLCAACYALECDTAPPARCGRCGGATYVRGVCAGCVVKGMVSEGLAAIRVGGG